jgi:hypothetical protein
MTDDDKENPKDKKQKPAKEITPSQRKLLDAAAVIWQESATAKEAAFMARELVQCSLPHKNPGNVQLWRRENGNVILAIQPGMNIKTGESYGYPYGIIPRLLLFWMITEAVRTKSRRLELGHSLRGFMLELGLDPSRGGERSDARRLRDQMERLFRSRFSFERSHSAEGKSGVTWLDMQVAPEGEFWWSDRDPEQGALWGSWIELGEKFFKAITALPVPVDMRALRALKKSPLALDLYAWLSYEAFRAHKGGEARFESWEQLQDHLGGEYAHLQHFRAKVKAALAKIRAVYPGLKLGEKQGGIEILPESFPALQPRGTTIEGECTTL